VKFHAHHLHFSSNPYRYGNSSTTMTTPDLEIVGLSASTNGRSCTRHTKCGNHVHIDDLLRLVKCVVTINGRAEEAVKLVKVEEGSDCCTVAFVPRVSSKLPKVQQNINRFVQVVEIYNDSDNTHKRRMANQNHGMASVAFIDDIPVGE
jgi:hypothetical protein